MKIEASITFDSLRSVNKLVAVTVPVKQAITAANKTTPGLRTIANKNRLVPLKVVYPKGDLLAGMTVFFREAEVNTAQEFQQTYKLPKFDADGKQVDFEANDNPEFVLVPEERVVMVDLTVPNATYQMMAVGHGG